MLFTHQLSPEARDFHPIKEKKEYSAKILSETAKKAFYLCSISFVTALYYSWNYIEKINFVESHDATL